MYLLLLIRRISVKVNIEALQKKLSKRLAKQRRNRKNWSAGFGYTLAKTKDFNIKKGKYIQGE